VGEVLVGTGRRTTQPWWPAVGARHLWTGAVAGVVAGALTAAALSSSGPALVPTRAALAAEAPAPSAVGGAAALAVPDTLPAPADGWRAAVLASTARVRTEGVAPATAVSGLLTFRGSATRSFHGTGPVPARAALDWSYPDRAMCGTSTVGEETTQWCGSGWTGQPAVVERDGRTWVVVGAYDRAVHFVDAETGTDVLPPFPTGDIIKGSVTVDPDGYPIVYTGSRDGRYRAIAIDGDAPRELWSLTAADATGPTRWNDDWDGAGLVLDDRLVVGGENSRLFVVQLNRGYDGDGRVTIDPEVLWDAAGWDDALLADVGDANVSFESSVTVVDGTAYLVNSGGLVQGWDLSALDRGEAPTRTFRYWVGDDADATIVAGDDGLLYVGVEHERGTARSAEVGQVVALDPGSPDDPLVWSFHDPQARPGQVAGAWGTPALHDDVVIVPLTGGALVGLDRRNGAVRWQLDLGDHLWSSPVVVDDVLIQGDCAGALHAFDLPPDGPPTSRWTVALGGCIESTPAVWAGRAYVGTRAGRLHAVAAAPAG
jgi:hypothetical protein